MRPHFVLIFSLFAISQCFRIDSVNDREARAGEDDVDAFKRVDTDGDWKISESEFQVSFSLNITGVKKIKLSNETIAEEFKAYDSDHDGYLSASEIEIPNVQFANKKNSATSSPSSIDGILKEADKNGNGAVTLAEAYDYLIQHSSIQLTKLGFEAEIRSLDKNHDGVLSASEIDPNDSSVF